MAKPVQDVLDELKAALLLPVYGSYPACSLAANKLDDARLLLTSSGVPVINIVVTNVTDYTVGV